MKPIEFKHSNKILTGPSGIRNLPVWTNGERCISKWKMSWWERLKCLCLGYVWLSVRSGSTQPSVKIVVEGSVIQKKVGDGKALL